MRAPSWLAVVALLVSSATAWEQNQSKATPRSRTHVVTIADMQFTPQTLDVAPGDTVVWINKDLVPHTATSMSGSSAAFDSQKIEPGSSWRYTVRAAGSFTYGCAYHPTMTGVVRVKQTLAPINVPSV